MEAAKRLALGLPLDINLAGLDELKLIPGVGRRIGCKYCGMAGANWTV